MDDKEKDLRKTIKSGILSKDRRDFLYKSGLFSVASTFGLSFFTGCSNSDDMEPDLTGDDNPGDDSTGNDNDPDNGGNTGDDSTGNDDNPDNGGSDDDGISIDGNQVTIDLNIQSDLKIVGGWLLIAEAQVLVVKVGENDFNALTSVCTHQGCDTNWSYQNNTFTCACHGSQFSSSGNVESGPAQSSLESYSVQLSGDLLTISK
ncbi:Rieske 2Fe-2S domain-containing protein [Echinicola jeungdonensis]|uniref:Ubiquinol-cytochrome c reductase iron-sulfur subunit n=1 Tax=Echinicola jeungdonensis TaxID=709343 RepID=A0ABV5J0M6_9BACT|nr:Rieske 2Fe-2S domain-containing protein [Echinicola jeungdonensis]MDN3667804.1 Rieske 2Fe-2S domain-containing protein [Echinicola jeungdonensis]